MNYPSLKQKIWISVATALVSGETFRRLSFKYFSLWIPPSLLLAIAVLILIAELIIPYYWNQAEKKYPDVGFTFKVLLERVMLYALALDLSMFGWHKIEHLQMIVPLGILDTPLSSFTGETLVWAFFKYSYPFTVSIAVLQIVTAVLLLFPMTRLAGLLLAVPSLVFVTALDFFYSMPVGVFIHGLILLLGVFCLLSQDYERLARFIFQPMPGLLNNGITFRRNIWIALSLFIWALFFHLIYRHPDWHPELTGKYSVKKLTVNQLPVSAQSPKDSVLTTVYLDLEDEIAFDFNDYRHRYIGRYYLDESNGSINIYWRYPGNDISPFKGKLVSGNDGLQMEGIMAGQKLRFNLVKEKPYGN